MTAATTRKSKPNESRSFPDPSAMRDAVATPTHLQPRKLCNNPTPPRLDFTLHMMTPCLSFPSDLSHITYHSMPVLPPHAAPPPRDAPSHAIIWEHWYFLGSEHDPPDNVKEIISISSLSCSTWALKHAVLTMFLLLSLFMLLSNDRHLSARTRLTLPVFCKCHCVCRQSKHQGRE